MKNILLLTGFMFWGIWGGLHAQEWKSEHFQFKLEDSTLVYSQTVIITPNNLDSLLATIRETEEIGDIYPPRSYEKECVINEWYHSVMYPRIIPRSILEVMRDLREEVYPSIQFSLLIDSTGHIFSAKIFLNRIILQKLTDEQLCELYDNIMAQPPIPFMKFYRIDKLPYTPEEKKRVEDFWVECVTKYGEEEVGRWTFEDIYEVMEIELGIKRIYPKYVWLGLPFSRAENLDKYLESKE